MGNPCIGPAKHAWLTLNGLCGTRMWHVAKEKQYADRQNSMALGGPPGQEKHVGYVNKDMTAPLVERPIMFVYDQDMGILGCFGLITSP